MKGAAIIAVASTMPSAASGGTAPRSPARPCATSAAPPVACTASDTGTSAPISTSTGASMAW